MAAVDITVTKLDGSGYNLSDSADFATLVAGAGEGVQVDFKLSDTIILRNTTGGAAVFTVKVANPTNVNAIGETVSDKTISVATGKDYLLVPEQIYKGAATANKITIECDVAGEVLVVNR